MIKTFQHSDKNKLSFSMIKTLKLIFILLTTFSLGQVSTNVFFSEFAEGTNYNKYLEIYNGSDSDIDLSQYAISRCTNGCDDESYWDFPLQISFEEGTIVLPGEVFVIANPNADSLILTQTDYFSSYLSNGDDVTGLVNASNGDIIDIIGDLGPDPGYGWDVAGVNEATRDHTLIRKSWVEQGNPDWASSAGTDSTNSEWIVHPSETWDYLGLHPGAQDGIYIYVATTGSDENGDGSLDNPFGTIQHTINQSTSFDTVLILQGHYYENIIAEGVNQTLVIGSEFMIAGDSSKISSTIISGQEAGYIFKYWSSHANSLIIDGLTFEGGHSEFQDEDGVSISGSSNFVFKNSVIRDCYVYWGQGTAMSVTATGTTLIENSKFINNNYGFGTHGTVRFFYSGEINVTNSLFKDNNAWTGSALRIHGTEVKVDSCLFINNTDIGDESLLNGYNSGAIWLDPQQPNGTKLISNSLFLENSGAVTIDEWFVGDTVKLQNLTVVDNQFGVSYSNWWNPVTEGIPFLNITNTIFYNNNLEDIYIPDQDWNYIIDGYININHSLIDENSLFADFNIGTNNTDYPTATLITNYEHEQKLQDDRRKIRLLDPSFISQFVTEYQSLMSESNI